MCFFILQDLIGILISIFVVIIIIALIIILRIKKNKKNKVKLPSPPNFQEIAFKTEITPIYLFPKNLSSLKEFEQVNNNNYIKKLNFYFL